MEANVAQLNPPSSSPWEELSPRVTEEGIRGAADRLAPKFVKFPKTP